jgi:hypothetical protein
MSVLFLRSTIAAFLFLTLAACGTLIAPYDDTFDQGLNKFSDDTAKLLASASAGAAEQSYGSKETTAYYASAYNLLDRLDARAQLSRASIACPANEALKATIPDPMTLPAGYEKYDCREVQLYIVRSFVRQLEADHKSGGALSRAEAKISGGQLQRAILGAIQVFLINKPSK